MCHRVGCILIVAAALAACAAPPPETRAARLPGSTNSAIAGKTLRCHAGGPVSNLTFAIDGTLSGRLLQSDVTGTWRAGDGGSVHTHVIAGAVSLRDTMRRRGARWVGRTTSCNAG